ncbi:MAG: hypothetical protein Kow0020_05480 [Wenzhouxiangellaceae bacterium]
MVVHGRDSNRHATRPLHALPPPGSAGHSGSIASRLVAAVFIAALAMGGLAGCGLKGDLYLPDDRSAPPAAGDAGQAEDSETSGEGN